MLVGRTVYCLLWVCLLSGAPVWCQPRERAGEGSELERVLQGAREQRAKYIEAFKNLTADETKVTEVFDEEGRLERRREVLASFLVYQSRNGGEGMAEFHVAREVDGRPVGDHVRRVERLFAALAKADSWRGEWKRLFRENTRHRLKYERWGVTLFLAGQIDEKAAPEFRYEAARGDEIDGRETIVLSYRRRSLDAGEVSGPNDRYYGDRGRLWLDAETLQIRRWENEKLVRHRESGVNYVRVRDVVGYGQSRLGMLVPRRIVTEIYDRVSHDPKRDMQGPRAAIGGRITFIYDNFRRFDVTGREELDPPR